MATSRKKTARARSSKPKAPKLSGGDSIVVASKLKSYIASKGMRSEGGLADSASKYLKHVLDNAIARARDAKRSTIRAIDL